MPGTIARVGGNSEACQSLHLQAVPPGCGRTGDGTRVAARAQEPSSPVGMHLYGWRSQVRMMMGLQCGGSGAPFDLTPNWALYAGLVVGTTCLPPTIFRQRARRQRLWRRGKPILSPRKSYGNARRHLRRSWPGSGWQRGFVSCASTAMSATRLFDQHGWPKDMDWDWYIVYHVGGHLGGRQLSTRIS